jgi:hypothetical protein
MAEQPVAISYSGGTSSEWMVEAIAQGVIPAPERFAVFFADTGAEHSWTYRAVDEVEERCRGRGVTFIRCTREKETLPEHIIRCTREKRVRMDHPPFWVQKDGGDRGRIQQRCTQIWKSRTLRKAQSAWLKSIDAPKRVTTWIGFGLDEQHRAVKAAARREVGWERLDFPAIRHGVTRAKQRDDLIRWTGRAPKFSMCTFCPFKSPARWAETDGADLVQAEAIDEAIRDLSLLGIDQGPAFCSDRLVPIRRARELANEPEPQTSFSFDVDASCDAGRCFL